MHVTHILSMLRLACFVVPLAAGSGCRASGGGRDAKKPGGASDRVSSPTKTAAVAAVPADSGVLEKRRERSLEAPSAIQEQPKAQHRAEAVRGVTRGVAVALRAGATVESTEYDPDRIAGMLRDTSSEAIVLSSEGLQSFKAWLQSDDGFEDQVVRRCKRGNAIGLLLFGEGDEVPSAEVAIDLACNSVALITGEGSSRRRMDAFLDPSRAELLQLLERDAPSLLHRNK